MSTTYEPHKRSSVSSESVSAIGSMSDRHSAIVSVPEDRASNVALAGSVLSYKVSKYTIHILRIFLCVLFQQHF